jgi:hypothetical protein
MTCDGIPESISGMGGGIYSFPPRNSALSRSGEAHGEA